MIDTLLRTLTGAACIAAMQFGSAHAAESAKTDATQAKLAEFASRFEESAIVSGPKMVSCKLSGGTGTTCFQITVTAADTVMTGPWCPRNIADGPDVSGIWLSDGEVYDADGPFVENLATFYDDPEWQMFDPETGAIRVTDDKTSCAAAARPDVDPTYNNYCVECLTSYMDSLPTLTFVIPVSPVIAKASTNLSQATGVGLAFNGVRFDESAPVDHILGAHTLAPFDDCGGHVNLHVGYHYHAVTGCTKEIAQPDAHAPLIGVAVDGFGIHARLNEDGTEPHDLDACRGHTFGDLGYHYHVSDPGRNQIIGCFSGETGCVVPDENGTCDATVKQWPPRP